MTAQTDRGFLHLARHVSLILTFLCVFFPPEKLSKVSNSMLNRDFCPERIKPTSCENRFGQGFTPQSHIYAMQSRNQNR